MSIAYEIVKSWANTDGTVNTMKDINGWIAKRNEGLKVNVKIVPFSYNGFWHYDEKTGYIRNLNNSFFKIAGYQEIENDRIINEQPVILQNEIGYLGIICKKINGVLNFLMQAKIEPGNINQIQISPTIQATKSNFTKQHGGASPAYLDYFVNATDYKIIVDQVQSEQSSRFFKKRNRNIIIMLDENEEIEVEKSHMWMTLGQIKELLKIDNLVNMDTRTVISCIPLNDYDITAEEKEEIKELFSDEALFNSIFKVPSNQCVANIFNKINDHRMYNKEKSRLVPIKSLKSWQLKEDEISCKTPYDFKIVYCYIEIEGREVQYWEQPLFKANGEAVFGIFTTVEDGIRKYLVCVKQEVGCFDGSELGPIVQLEPTNPRNKLNSVEKIFLDKLDKKENVVKDIMLSEEGGRFYHEQNRNVIINIDKSELGDLPDGYYWVDYATLNHMIQFNNCINIQLRNLLALIEL